jgi:hypothetical protein
MPFNVDTCLASIFGMAANLPGVATGGIPGLGSGSVPSVGRLNLAACVPFNTIGTLPGLGSLISLLVGEGRAPQPPPLMCCGRTGLRRLLVDLEPAGRLRYENDSGQPSLGRTFCW